MKSFFSETKSIQSRFKMEERAPSFMPQWLFIQFDHHHTFPLMWFLESSSFLWKPLWSWVTSGILTYFHYYSNYPNYFVLRFLVGRLMTDILISHLVQRPTLHPSIGIHLDYIHFKSSFFHPSSFPSTSFTLKFLLLSSVEIPFDCNTPVLTPWY